MDGVFNVSRLSCVHQSALDLIEVEDRSELLQKLASSLIKNATAANEFESVIYVAGRLSLVVLLLFYQCCSYAQCPTHLVLNHLLPS